MPPSPNAATSPFPQIPVNVTFSCPRRGRYVSVHVPLNGGYPTPPGYSAPPLYRDGYINLAEVEVRATSSTCPARTGFNSIASGSCGAGAAAGAVCTQTCSSETSIVAAFGAPTVTCDGDGWGITNAVAAQTGVVCLPKCANLPAPDLATCTQVWTAEPLNERTDATQWASLDPVGQPMGSFFAFADGALQAAARPGCYQDLHLVHANEKVSAWTGAFTVSVLVSSPDRAGLVFKATSRLSFYRVNLDFAAGVHLLERMTATGLVTLTVSNVVRLQPDTLYALVVSVDGQGGITVALNGTTLMAASDPTLLTYATPGYAGVYARTYASFNQFVVSMPCPGNVCTGSTGTATVGGGGDSCVFTCAAGLVPTNPDGSTPATSRSCASTAGGFSADFVPTLAAVPLFVCAPPPPSFTPTTLVVPENSAKNALVGDALVASSANAAFQVRRRARDNSRSRHRPRRAQQPLRLRVVVVH